MKCRMGPEAAHCLYEGLKSHSSSIKTELALAEALFAIGKDHYALDCLKRILRHDPRRVPALQMWLSYAAQSSAQRKQREALEEELEQIGVVSFPAKR